MAISNRLDNSVCFCTAAFGNEYTRLAKLLADDLNQFAPGYPFVVFTDRPELLQDHPNVIAIKHWCRGVQPYHERRFAIQYALSLAPSAMYFDADVRVCAPITHSLKFEPGLAARSCGGLQKHMQRRFKKSSPKDQRKLHIVQQMAQRVNIDLDSPNLKFINEFLFVVTADQGRELDFLRLWGELAIYADTLGMYQHPTYAMALAANKCGFPVFHNEMEGLNFFDDRIEAVKISKGQAAPNEKSEYFKQQSKIEHKKTRLQRLSKSLSRKALLVYNRLRVQTTFLVSPDLLVNYPQLISPAATRSKEPRATAYR